MFPTRRWALVALALAASLVLSGCTRTRQAREWWERKTGRQPAAEQVRGSAAPEAAAPEAGKPYLASMIALRTLAQGNILAVAAVNLNTIVANQPAEFVVVNKWGMVPPGRHQEVIYILAPDRRERIASDETEFEVNDFYRNTVIVSEFQQVFTRAGNYWVQIRLDGKLVNEYPFRVRPAEP